MGKYVTVSVKIPVELKEEMERLGVKPSKMLRKIIEAEIRRRKVEELKREIDEVKPILKKIPVDEVVRLIREERERR